MANPIIEALEKQGMKRNLPAINVGDTVRVSKVIVEGKKKRVQKFEGVIIKRQGRFNHESVTVRKIIDRVGVEKSFLLHSPLVPEIEVVRRGKVRRARLHYLRNRIGVKATRVKARD